MFGTTHVKLNNQPSLDTPMISSVGSSPDNPLISHGFSLWGSKVHIHNDNLEIVIHVENGEVVELTKNEVPVLVKAVSSKVTLISNASNVITINNSELHTNSKNVHLNSNNSSVYLKNDDSVTVYASEHEGSRVDDSIIHVNAKKFNCSKCSASDSTFIFYSRKHETQECAITNPYGTISIDGCKFNFITETNVDIDLGYGNTVTGNVNGIINRCLDSIVNTYSSGGKLEINGRNIDATLKDYSNLDMSVSGASSKVIVSGSSTDKLKLRTYCHKTQLLALGITCVIIPIVRTKVKVITNLDIKSTDRIIIEKI